MVPAAGRFRLNRWLVVEQLCLEGFITSPPRKRGLHFRQRFALARRARCGTTPQSQVVRPLPQDHATRWVFIELARKWYVREAGWKLNQTGELFDMSDAPFAEKLIAADSKDAAATAARQRPQAVLDELNPAGGILDDGDGTGRHANKDKKKGISAICVGCLSERHGASCRCRRKRPAASAMPPTEHHFQQEWRRAKKAKAK